MAKNLKKELIDLKIKSKILDEESCSSVENKEYEQLVKDGMPLPKGVYPYINDDGKPSTKYFYKVAGSEFTQDELMEYIALKQLKMVRTIKNCVVYFTAISVAGSIVGAIYALLTIID